ncbi:hypothetical protein BH18ACT9_BH18ACT9_16290 [soil metagenome]
MSKKGRYPCFAGASGSRTVTRPAAAIVAIVLAAALAGCGDPDGGGGGGGYVAQPEPSQTAVGGHR